MPAVVGLPHKAILSSGLSFKAIGLLMYVLASSDDIISDDTIMNAGKLSRDELDSTQNELVHKGYAVVRDDDYSIDYDKLYGFKCSGGTIQQTTNERVPQRKITAIPYEVRLSVLVRDGFKCRYCYCPTYMLDHVQPKSRDGSNHPTNLVACCVSCNSRKGPRTPQEAGMALLEIRKDS